MLLYLVIVIGLCKCTIFGKCQFDGIFMKDLMFVLYFVGRSLLLRYLGWIGSDLTGSVSVKRFMLKFSVYWREYHSTLIFFIT